MAQGSFSAQVNSWVAKSKARIEAVRKEGAQRVVEIAQTPRAVGGNMRVDTGFLRASLIAFTGTAMPPQTVKPDGIANFTYDGGAIALVIAGSLPTDVLTFVWTANYARPREYGSRGQAGDRFVGLAAQQWQRIIDEVGAEVVSRTGG